MTDSTTVISALDSLVRHTTVGDVGRALDEVARVFVIAFAIVLAIFFAVAGWAWHLAKQGSK